ncbi:antibiotic acetyltransferase [Treponema ruminis]|uniref:Acetyltransferase-like isoleucine patch superfamily enzyme n=1 Tax=Treponema ruminis TaxID=744515 RepID=A0A7W8GA18_9SPIR|nr:CatB-related O-acetyltransferase [Treponema ruminis]MBB5226586.1 acetyltransferase-like isoleucine patch superfamily enzyme [Treponema ruminis]QSI02184.1 antibiotic acetyltransferase [Treponema ruminis]
MIVSYYINLYLFRKKYRKQNKHNETTIMNFCDLKKVVVGKKSYGIIDVFDGSPSNNKLVIGNYCSIANGVKFLLGGEHKINCISTFPFKVKCFGYEKEADSKGNIIISDDVWICTNAIICSGVSIGQGAVIAAGAVVTRDVEPYSIVGGNPAHFIRWRFDENLRKRLLSIDIVKLFDSFTEKKTLIYEPLSEDILDKILIQN